MRRGRLTARDSYTPGGVDRRLHILLLTDRDWTHPQAGGTGTNLWAQVSRWLAWGHRVTVIACSYDGAPPLERDGSLTIHRLGGRSTVFPRAILKQWRGLVPDADVVLEVVNGISFLAPLWLRKPHVALVHHIHRDHYVKELGWAGRLAALLLETIPLRVLYRGTRVTTISEASARDIAAHGIPREHIAVNYIGVEQDAFWPDESLRTPEPTLLYLGRLKRYKRIELLLDVLEGVPEATLDIAGEGDHREELEAEIEERGLRDRVRMHGFVSEELKRELLQRSWVNLTASSAEGWCLTVMEAGACATPTVAIGVGGIPEAIEDGRSGLLAKNGEELTAHVRRLAREPEVRRRLGEGARERSREFNWERAAAANLELLREEAEAERDRLSLTSQIARSDTGRAAGLAAALMTNNFIALIFTVVFAHLLGASGYGSLGALLAAFTILVVPGSALQATVAREVSAAAVTPGANPSAGIVRWLRNLLGGTALLAVLALPLREPMGALVGVDFDWAAGAILPTAGLWLVLCVQRGALQGLQRYRVVGLSIIGEAGTRLTLGLGLYGLGLGVSGAFLGTTASITAMALALVLPLRGALAEHAVPSGAETEPHILHLLKRAWVPVVAFALIAALQNLDIVYVKHAASDDAAGSYAAASVAAKAVIWVAIGLGLYLLPEAVRRTRTGEDARPVLTRTMVLIAAVALPMVAVYAVAGRQVLAGAFGEDLTAASDALPLLAFAMSLLAWAYLSVQYLLALGRVSFVFLLGLAAPLELALLVIVGAQLTSVAATLVGLQLVLAPTVFALVLRSAARARSLRAPEALA
jgi:glycosyltransferase involved in cell wall biosynthesis/O-antigen/teichoic acid export membrane protein